MPSHPIPTRPHTHTPEIEQLQSRQRAHVRHIANAIAAQPQRDERQVLEEAGADRGEAVGVGLEVTQVVQAADAVERDELVACAADAEWKERGEIEPKDR